MRGRGCGGRALGDADFKEGIGDGTVICAPDVRQVDLGPEDDAVVMASDGVWDMVDDQQAVDIVLSTVQVVVRGAPALLLLFSTQIYSDRPLPHLHASTESEEALYSSWSQGLLGMLI